MTFAKELISQISRPKPEKHTRSSVFRFDRNERTTLFDQDEFQAIISQITPYDLVAYGELEPFYEKIADWLKVDRNNILLTSGSDAGIKSVFEAFVGPGDEVLNPQPNYAMFSVYAKMFGAREINVSYDSNLHLDVKAFINKINSRTKLVIISNPSHTGTVVLETHLQKIGEIAEKHGALFLVDEAYHHFYPQTMLRFIRSMQNLIITRTFSKAFGLASLRIGLLVACEELIEDLYRVKLVHEITGVAAKVGQFMIENLYITERYVDNVNQGKSILYEKLEKLGFRVYESQANFIFFTPRFSLDSDLFIKKLEERNIFIKGPFSIHPFTNHLRITVGDPEQMNLFCKETEKLLQICMR